jgi:hypothetical protein
MKRLLAVVALAAAACIPEEGPMMEPGAPCLDCHGGGGGEEDAVAWTVAGTWSGQGLHVYIQDVAGKSFTIRTNQAGSFYTREPLQFPIRVAVEGVFMNQPAQLSPPDNDCNRCHGSGGEGGGG